MVHTVVSFVTVVSVYLSLPALSPSRSDDIVHGRMLGGRLPILQVLRSIFGYCGMIQTNHKPSATQGSTSNLASVVEVGSEHGRAAAAATGAAEPEAGASKGATAVESLDSKFNVFRRIAESSDGTGTAVTDKQRWGFIERL